VIRCTDCGFIPLLQVVDDDFVKRAQDETQCEGAYVMEQVAAEAVETTLLPVSPAVGLTVQREAQPVQRPASSHTRYEPTPLSDEKSGLRALLPQLPVAVVAIVVVILVVLLVLQ